MKTEEKKNEEWLSSEHPDVWGRETCRSSSDCCSYVGIAVSWESTSIGPCCIPFWLARVRKGVGAAALASVSWPVWFLITTGLWKAGSSQAWRPGYSPLCPSPSVCIWNWKYHLDLQTLEKVGRQTANPPELLSVALVCGCCKILWLQHRGR